MVKGKTKSEESAAKDDKKRALAKSRASAKRWREDLKREHEIADGSPSSASDDTPSAKKAKRSARVPSSKKEKRDESRKRAQKYAQGLSIGTSGGELDDSDGGSDAMGASAADDPWPVDPLSTPPPAPAPGPAGRRSGARHENPLPPLQRPPLMTQIPPSVSSRPPGKGRVQPSRKGSTQSPSQAPSQASASSRRKHTFLRRGVKSDDKGPAVAASAFSGGRQSIGSPEVPVGPGPRERQTFLRNAPNGEMVPRVPGSKGSVDWGLAGGTPSVRIPRRQEAEMVPPAPAAEAAAAAADVGADEANPPGNGPRPSRAGIWAFNCAAAVLVPFLACFLVWSVHTGVLLAWPRVQLSLGSALSALAGVTGKSAVGNKCFLHQSEQEQIATICEEDSEPTECPNHAVCNAGRILGCSSPFTVSKYRTGCVLDAAAEDEANSVVEALRTLTFEQLCKGNGLIMPKACSGRSSMTLTEAAAALNRGPLSLLARMPPGNVAGRIDLEGDPAPEFHEGEDVDGACAGSGSERLVRLSESTHDAIMLAPPWRCKARLAAGRWLLAYWLHCLGLYGLVLLFVCRDLRRLKEHNKRVEVCTMRDECYKALLAADASPLEVSHMQDHVGDRRRVKIGGNQATIKQKVRELWPLVEKEVECDTRIKRNFKNLRGQRNVACWCWVGPRHTNFESIGALDPGPMPRLWVLRWLHHRRPAP